jgi:hypothetical protein
MVSLSQSDQGFSADKLFNYLTEDAQKLFRSLKVSNRANVLAWRWAYSAEAALIAHRRTGDHRFLQWLVTTYNQALSLRDCELGLMDSYRKRITKTWGTGIYDQNCEWISHISLGGRITYPSLDFADLVLNERQRYASFVDDALHFIDAGIEAIEEYKEDFISVPRQNICYYYMPLKNKVEAVNHVNSFINSLIILYKLTKNATYRERAQECCQVFKNEIQTTASGAYYWHLRPRWAKTKQRSNPPERIWKAQVSAATAQVAYRNSIVFNRADMDGFAKTFTDIIYVGGDQFRIKIDPETDELAHISLPYSWRVRTITGFLKWSEFIPEIQDIIHHLVETRTELFRGWLSCPSLARGYAYLI